MTVYLVIWSECDSGYEIKAGFLTRKTAQKKCNSLNLKKAREMVAENEKWLSEHGEAAAKRIFRGHHPWAGSSGARLNSWSYAYDRENWEHHVEEVEVR